MMYATIDGYMTYIGVDEKDFAARYHDTSRRLEDCEARMLAYIIPRTPCTEAEIAAFCTAVYAQLEHETSGTNAQLATMPEGLTGFTVNGFSAQLSGASGGSFGAAGLSRRARAELALAGLSYKGVITC